MRRGWRGCIAIYNPRIDETNYSSWYWGGKKKIYICIFVEQNECLTMCVWSFVTLEWNIGEGIERVSGFWFTGNARTSKADWFSTVFYVLYEDFIGVPLTDYLWLMHREFDNWCLLAWIFRWDAWRMNWLCSIYGVIREMFLYFFKSNFLFH